MIKPDPEVVHALAPSVHQYPILKEWIDNWRMHELEQLPNVATNTALAQGRCQVLSELHKLLRDAPSISAKS